MATEVLKKCVALKVSALSLCTFCRIVHDFPGLLGLILKPTVKISLERCMLGFPRLDNLWIWCKFTNAASCLQPVWISSGLCVISSPNYWPRLEGKLCYRCKTIVLATFWNGLLGTQYLSLLSDVSNVCRNVIVRTFSCTCYILVAPESFSMCFYAKLTWPSS